ncbi:MAG: DNA repair protein RecO [Firmicutes bacterium]|nr:DNA repair protein RecO [Bacillota bacterium]
MLTDTEGIVLRQIKTSYNRRMIVLFSRKYGKIRAGTSLGDKGRSKSSLALRPFTFGRYELFVNRDSYNINSAEVLRSYYKIGEDVDKYMNGAYVLEFTEKVLEEGVPQTGVFDLLIDFFTLLENREKGIGTLVLAYQTKLLNFAGVMPQLNRCVVCGKPREECAGEAFLSIPLGGFVCSECAGKQTAGGTENSAANTLIYKDAFGIIDILKYFAAVPLKKLEKIALNETTGKELQQWIREYAAYHLDVSNIKSEKLI